MGTTHPSPGFALMTVAIAVAVLVVLATRCKVPSFIALLVCSIGVGIANGLAPLATLTAFQEGFGNLLGSIGIVVGLGAILGRWLGASQGAAVIAEKFVAAFGEKNLPFAMLLTGFVVGLPVFFGVGLVLLLPVLFSVAKRTQQPFLKLALPLVTGLSAAHGLVPPHPGPMAAIGLLKADPGRTLLWSILIGFPASLVGLIIWRFSPATTAAVGIPTLTSESSTPPPKGRPGFSSSLFTVLLPALLMIGSMVLALASQGVPETLRQVIALLGHPSVAMLAGVGCAAWLLGLSRGFKGKELLKLAEDSLGPTAGILFVVGAGGGFSKVLIASGIAQAISDASQHWSLSPLVLAWTVAAVIRVASGSATVAITTAAGMMQPWLAAHPEVKPELIVISLGAGSLVLSHVNDGGFWLVKEFLGLSVIQTFKTWTLMETLLSVLTLLILLGLHAVGVN